MARGRAQIPVGWRREGPTEVYYRPAGSTDQAARLEVYSGYEAGRLVTYLAILYDGSKWPVPEWRNLRYSGSNLRRLETTLAEVKAAGYQAQS